MTPRCSALSLPLLALAPSLALGLSGCGQPESHASAVERAACTRRADQVYMMQNREQVYQSDTFATSTRDAPFAASGLPDVPSRGLSGDYARDQMISDCVKGNAGNIGATPAAPAPDATPPP
jgi:hypothetical protein